MERLQQGDPRSLGRYRMLARIGAGGTATVYLARSRGGRSVAVKVMHAELAREPEYRGRFRREVEAATAVGGTHSPPVLDAAPEAATPWMATEFLPSLSLRDAVERYGPLPTGSLRRLAAGLAESLAAIHRTGIVHLDVKPANVLLTADGPRLIDFGIAANARSTGHAGSRGFMSPEQMAGEAGPPSDVYSLGTTLQHARGRGSTDAALASVIAECRHENAECRPTAVELTRRLAALAPYAERPDAAWLPPAIMAAIDAQASAAANPPPPARALPTRRLWLAGGAVTAVTGAAIALDRLVGRSPSGRAAGPARPPGDDPPTATPPAGPPPWDAAEPAVLQFVITGDGPLTSLAYAVNGRFTTLRDVSLSWRKSIEVPRRLGRVDWRLRLTAPSPDLTYRVSVDGAEKWHGPQPAATRRGPAPYRMDASGSVAFSDPSRTPRPRVLSTREEGPTP